MAVTASVPFFLDPPAARGERRNRPGEIVADKMTLMPAQCLEKAFAGARRLGRMQEGAQADVVVFDADAIRDMSSFRAPAEPSVGVRYLSVAGVLVVDGGQLVEGAAPGVSSCVHRTGSLYCPATKSAHSPMLRSGGFDAVGQRRRGSAPMRYSPDAVAQIDPLGLVSGSSQRSGADTIALGGDLAIGAGEVEAATTLGPA